MTFALSPNKILNFCALLSNVHAKLPASNVCILCLKNMQENVNRKKMLKIKIHDKMILAFLCMARTQIIIMENSISVNRSCQVENRCLLFNEMSFAKEVLRISSSFFSVFVVG